MATFPNKPAAYTVDTGHAKCPDIAYLLDATSGSPTDDVGSLDLTNQGSPTWTTADLGGGGPASSNVLNFLGTTYANRTSGLAITTGICMVAIWKSNSTTNPVGTEIISGVRNAGTSLIDTRITLTNAYQSSYIDDTTTAASSNIGTADLYDTNWRMSATKAYQDGANVLIGRSTDGAAWATSTQVATATFDQTQIGMAANPAAGGKADITMAALFIYLDDAANWTNDWIGHASTGLYVDPWQFLSSGTVVPVFMNQYRQRRA